MPTCALPNLDDVLDAHVDGGRRTVPRHPRRAVARRARSRADDRGRRAGRAVRGPGVPRRRRPARRARSHLRLVALPLPEPRVPGARPRRARHRRWCSTTSARRSASVASPIERDEIFAAWQDDIAAIARCENVVAKLGGLAMPDNGFGWHTADRPPTSDEFVAAQGRYYRHTIECFGPERCMFESNFPVDRMSISYRVLWNALEEDRGRTHPPTSRTRCSPAPRRASTASTETCPPRAGCRAGTPPGGSTMSRPRRARRARVVGEPRAATPRSVVDSSLRMHEVRRGVTARVAGVVWRNSCRYLRA